MNESECIAWFDVGRRLRQV